MHRFLLTCGNGFMGRLGLGHRCSSENFPRLVGTLIGYRIQQVACGGAHTACVSDDGSLLTFGQNDRGQLGHSSEDQYMPLPLEVGMPDAVKSVSAGENHTLCLTTSGEVWSFGSNDCGQLGIGKQDDQKKHAEPRLVKDLKGTKVVAVSAGTGHSLALTADGEVYSWGQSDYGALGLGPDNLRQVRAPTRVRALAGTKVRSITSGFFSSGCIDDNGRAYTWGNGLYWQLGHGEAIHEYVPRRLEAVNVCGSLSLGQMHGLATGFNGQVLAWGTDDHGSLGQGEGVANWQRVPVKKPKEVTGLHHSVKSVSCGWKHSVAVTTDGKALTWGWNGAYHSDPFTDSGSGQLGHGDDKDRWAPVQVMRFRSNDQKFYDLRMPFLKPWRVIQAAAGRNHTAMVVEAEVHSNDLQ